MAGPRGFGAGPRIGGGPRGILTQEEKDNMPKITKKMIKRIYNYLRPYWLQFSFVFIAILITSILGIIPALLTRQIVDIAIPNKDIQYLFIIIAASFGATIALNLINVLENYINTWISQHIIYDMKNEMYNHIQNMSHRFFSTEKQGDLITRMTSDISGVQSVVNGTLTNAVSNIFVLSTTLVVLFSLSWKLALLSLITVPLFVIPTKKVGKTRWGIVKKSQEKNDEMNQILNETLSVSGSLLVKLFTRETKEYNKFRNINNEMAKLNIKENMAGQWFRMVIGTVTTIGPMLIYLIGGIYIAKGDPLITIGTIITVVTLLNRLYMPVISILNIQVDLIRSMALFERIFDYLDRKIDVKNILNPIVPEKIDGNIEFKNVYFDYDKDIPILKDISFNIPKGKMFALVGPSGAGKSTITNLIPRLYDVSKGSITIDGYNICDLDLKILRSAIGVVTQDTYLFNGTVRENLLYACDDSTDEEMIEACITANIHDFIMSLPMKYETIVGNRGVKLSGGEKQRISIARVILKDPKILILDEATSSLDSISEKLIQDAIEPLLKGRTSLVIAHRLSTIVAADQILVVEEGKIAESGTHDELIKEAGVYKTLYETQFRKALEKV